MKEHTAEELQGHRIRIENSDKLPVPIGHRVWVTDLDTGEPIRNVTAIDLHIVPRECVTARLTLLHIGKAVEQPDGSWEAFLTRSSLTVRDPELDLTAFVAQD